MTATRSGTDVEALAPALAIATGSAAANVTTADETPAHRLPDIP
jgi:hypothetical protein